MERHGDPAHRRALRWLGAHALSAVGMTATVVLSAVATSSVLLSHEYGDGVRAGVGAVLLGTLGVLAARAILRQPLATAWLALPPAVLAATFALASVSG